MGDIFIEVKQDCTIASNILHLHCRPDINIMLETISNLTSEVSLTPAQKWISDHQFFAFQLVSLYVPFVYVGQRYFIKREGYSLSNVLALWNLLLAVFSTFGFLGTYQDFFKVLRTDGLNASYCSVQGYYKGSTGFWVLAFVLSKIIELGDTVFLVLRKRPVLFMHWYHHASVLIYVWYGYPLQAGTMRWGVVMNYAVHSVMYTYFFLRAIHFPVPRPIGKCITTMQIVQFLFGTYVTTASLIHNLTGTPCEISLSHSTFQAMIYVSYLVLFVQFFIRAYCTPKPSAERPKKE